MARCAIAVATAAAAWVPIPRVPATGLVGGGDAGFFGGDQQPVDVVGEGLRVPVVAGVEVDGQVGLADDPGQYVTAGSHDHSQARLACQRDQQAGQQRGGRDGLVDGVDDHDPARLVAG